MTYPTLLQLTLDRIDAGHKIKGTITNAKSNTPIVVIWDQAGSGEYDEIRFGINSLSISDVELQIQPHNKFKWADFKKFKSEREIEGEMAIRYKEAGRDLKELTPAKVSGEADQYWRSRGDELPFDVALKIWKSLEFSWDAE